jgi:hypothetical protein
MRVIAKIDLPPDLFPPVIAAFLDYFLERVEKALIYELS